uniref:Phenylalanine ammonia-lyase n=1 Tax=Nelumbo nucifera TaxID=4432 RepID=A0A822ZW05_NELNU|nr:TPA_asm: hypothetical protein HUJ06_019004 [Nelumbo nucifera]
MATDGIRHPVDNWRPPTLPIPKDGENPIWTKVAEALQCTHYEEVRCMVPQFQHIQTVNLQGTTLTVAQVAAVARRSGVTVSLDEGAARDRVTKSANWIAHTIARGTDTLGVTAGFGAASHRRTNKTTGLQTELIRFLNTGVIGKENLPSSYAKAAILVRTNTLMQGYSGIR